MKRVLAIITKILLGTIGTLLILIVVAILLFRLPSVQNYVTHKVVSSVSSKTHTRIELKHIYLAFPKSVVIEGLFAEDINHDTLLSLEKLEIDIDMLALLKKKVEVNSLYLGGVNANLKRNIADSTFNFNFLVQAFSPSGKKNEADKPATDTVGWKVGVKKVRLENIRGVYADELTGMDIRGVVGILDLNMKGIDIRTLNFNGNELSLTDSRCDIVINNSSVKEAVDSARALLPSIAMNKLTLKNVHFSLKQPVAGFSLVVNAGNLVTFPEHIDLNKQLIAVKSLQMDSTNTSISLSKNEKEDSTDADEKENNIPGYKQGWQVTAGNLKFNKVDFSLDIGNKPLATSGVDYSHMHMQNISLDINNASYSAEIITADIQKLALTERSGVVIKNLTAKATYDDQHAELADLSLTTAHSHITNRLAISYPSIKTLGKNIGALGLNANLRNTTVDLDDILQFAPMLKTIPPFNGKAGKMFMLNGNVKGQLKDVFLTGLEVKGQGPTFISLTGHIKGLPDAAHAFYDVDLKKLKTTKADMQLLLGDKLPATINVPESIDLTAKLKGTFTDIAANFNLQTSSGDAAGDVSLKRLPGDTSYIANLTTRAFDVGYILKKDTLLGPVTGTINLKGQGFSIASLKADVTAELQSITLNRYSYSNILLTAAADANTYKADLSVKDKNLVLDMKSDVSLVKGQESVKVDLNLDGADLQKLHVLKQDLKVSGKLNTDLKGTIDNLTGQAGLNDVVFIKGEETYRVGSFAALSVNDKKHSAVKIKSGIINADYQGSMQLSSVGKTLVNYVNNYFKIKEDTAIAAIDTSLQDFTLQVSILPHPLINGVILPDLEKFNGAEVKVDFNNQKQKLDVEASVTGLSYKGKQLDNMEAEVHADEKAMKYSIAFDRFKMGSLNLSETTLDGKIQGDSIDFALKVHDRDSANKLIVAGFFTQDKPKEYVLRLDNRNLVFANQNWVLPEDNYVRFMSGGFYVHMLDLSSKEQVLSVRSEKDDVAAPIKIEFKQFQLGTLSQIMEKDTGLIRGLLNGTAELRNLQGAPAFVSDLHMDNVAFKQNAIGNIQIKADNLVADKYTAQVIISGADNDVKVSGYYAPSGNENQLNFKADVNKLQLHSVEGFTNGQLRNTSGYLTGTLTISGGASQPVINGDMRFKDVSANVAYLNNQLSLKDERVKIDGKGVYFSSFKVQDATGQQAVINGNVFTTDFRKMKFDMSVTTNRFNVMNTTIADNPLYFGHVVVTSTISIKGDETLPIIKANAKLLGGSDFTVVVPPSKIKVDRGEGVVVLIDTDATDADAIMSNRDTIPVELAGFKGIELLANLEVTKETQFKVILDRIYGDSLVVSGDGMLSFGMDETGQQSLTGTYVLSGGSYRANLLGITPKAFKIQSGSTITWNGRPTDALVNITAVYNSRTSPADLLASDMAGSTTAEMNVYHKLLNFMVLLNMKGDLLKPNISFQLDMADEDKNAFGGVVYAKLNSLNNDPNELNKQVFSLLVLNSFAPSGNSGGGDANSAATNLARNSVNQVLSNQLNSLSGRYIKGVDLNFGIQTNDDYTTTGVQQQTELSVGLKKEFFNNRLSVQVGTSINISDNTGAIAQSGTGNNIPGDFIVEYKITKDGRYKFKAFRQNQYESLIDGLLYKTGIGIVYTRDYDTIKQLFSRAPKEKEDEPKEDEPKETVNP